MKKILFFCLSIFIFGISDDECSNLDRFNEKQIENIRYAYHYGKRDNLGFILAAIAWQESCAGMYRLNMQDPSAGNYHTILSLAIKIDRKMKKLKKKTISNFDQNVMAERLICDREFASKIALYQLREWKIVRGNNLRDMLRSYNGGTNIEGNQKAERYADEILRKKQRLEEFFEQNPEMYRPYANF